jgi:hypothetical protein
LVVVSEAPAEIEPALEFCDRDDADASDLDERTLGSTSRRKALSLRPRDAAACSTRSASVGWRQRRGNRHALFVALLADVADGAWRCPRSSLAVTTSLAVDERERSSTR